MSFGNATTEGRRFFASLGSLIPCDVEDVVVGTWKQVAP